MEKMFCFQCEQTVKNKGCRGNAGVCEKTFTTSNLQDQVINSLINLSHLVVQTKSDQTTDRLILEGLFTTITNVNFDDLSLINLINRIDDHYQLIVNSISNQNQIDLTKLTFNLWDQDHDIRSLKSLILFGLKGMAAYGFHALNLDYYEPIVLDFFYKALQAIGHNNDFDQLLSLVFETGAINLKCLEILDKAHNQKFGNPTPTTVSLTIEPGPFIVVSGHDLHDLELLLQQTKGKGINIYTHSEMLPAHGYPHLKKYPHLRGNFGTAWQNQQHEFDHLPAPILFTTNCLMTPKKSYQDRVFTTEVVRYPGLFHIDSKKDFTVVINKALELGGYSQPKKLTGINGGTTVTTGFGHHYLLSHANAIIDGIKSKAIRHIFLVGGCDGAKTGRNYYTEFVKKVPNDCLILTLACGKYRFNDLDLGSINGIPRLLDAGQCNDAYSAIVVALALSQAFNCDVNQLPLTLVLSWYEQKAVAILLTLLNLGIKNILIGPSLPQFISPNVLSLLVDNNYLIPISTPDDDLAKILGN